MMDDGIDWQQKEKQIKKYSVLKKEQLIQSEQNLLKEVVIDFGIIKKVILKDGHQQNN